MTEATPSCSGTVGGTTGSGTMRDAVCAAGAFVAEEFATTRLERVSVFAQNRARSGRSTVGRTPPYFAVSAQDCGMTDLDQATTRRDITDALLTALERRHEVLDAIVDADDHEAAVSAIAELLGKSALGAEAVLGMRLNQLTKAERRKNQAELDDLNSTLTFTLAERPASSGDTLEVRAFCADDADIFAVRTEELKVAGDGSGEPAGPLADEIAKGRTARRRRGRSVAGRRGGGHQVGLIFGELSDGEVDVRIWIHPDKRKQGYGVAALRKSRSEMASLFPGVPMVVRGPSS